MSMRTSPITAQLGKLSLGNSSSGTSIFTSIRLASSKARLRRPCPTTPIKEPTAPLKKKKKGDPRIEPRFEPGHGEKIYIFNHFLEGMVVYSHRPVMKANKAMRQIPFNGKKLKPAKLRKDYWQPMAMIQFPEGQGEVGRSVFQRLRECKKLHEYSWDDSYLYKPETGRTLTTRERGRRLNDQRANTVADMAAVLGGLGKGNRILVSTDATVESKAVAGEGESKAVATEGEAQTQTETQTKAEGEEHTVKTADGKTLVKATVWWNDILYRNYAKKWTKNVEHQKFVEAVIVPTEAKEAADAAEGELLQGAAA